jgi:hypothetical protein
MSLSVAVGGCSAQPLNETPAYRNDLLIYVNGFLDGETRPWLDNKYIL